MAAVYKPPNVNINIFNKRLEKIFIAIQKERKYAFSIGDYNINTKDELQCKSTLTNDFINLHVMSLYSYKKLISVPTRVINNSSTVIENIYSNFPDIYNNGTSGVLGCIRTTDRMPIFSIGNVCTGIIKGEAFKLKKNFGNQNVSKLRKKLKNLNWNNVYTEECVQMAFSEFMKIVISNLNECCPLEKVKINYKNRHDWVTKELKADMKKREELFKRSRVWVKCSTCTWYLYLSTYLSVLDVLEYLVYGNVKVLVLVLDHKVLGT